jgi:soluble lytic murein transglycosylase-like protein
MAQVFIAAEVGASPIYVYREGRALKFSSKPPPASVRAQVFTGKSASFSISGAMGRYRPAKVFDKKEYDSIIRSASARYGVRGSIIKAVIHAESAFNPRAVSPKGALGLMQLMPFNLRTWKVSDPFSPQQNIHGGAGLLSRLMRKYRGNLRLALAAYNAGEGAVQKYSGVPPYGETLQYVQRVMDLEKRYRTLAS